MRKTEEHPTDDALLDALFDAARRDAPLPSGALMARLQDTALAEQPRPPARQAAQMHPARQGAQVHPARQAAQMHPAQQAAPAHPARQGQSRPRGMLRQLVDALGGWPAVAGLATAGVAGLWIGAFPPQAMAALFGAADLTLMAPYDLTFLDEES